MRFCVFCESLLSVREDRVLCTCCERWWVRQWGLKSVKLPLPRGKKKILCTSVIKWTQQNHRHVLRLIHLQKNKTILLPPLRTALENAPIELSSEPSEVLLVPIPSRWGRGGHAQAICNHLARERGHNTAELFCSPAWQPLQKKRSKQSRLLPMKRLSMGADRPCSGTKIYLVDDLATTGASLERAVVSLEVAGLAVGGCIVLAAHPLLSSS